MIPVLRSTFIAAALAQAVGAAAPRWLSGQEGERPPVVTLAQARRRAAAVDPAAVASRAAVGTAAWERRAAVAALLTPSLRAGTSFTSYSNPFFNFATGNESFRHTNASLEASYTLVGAGKLAHIRSARAAVASAEAREAATRFRTALATDAAYYAVLAESELSRVAADRLRRATEQLGVARVRVQAGETIATDSLQLLLEVNRARLDVLRRDSAVMVVRLRLGRQVGASGAVDAAPLDSGAPPAPPIALEAAVVELRARGPEIEAARASERGAGAALAAVRETYLPDLKVSAVANGFDSEFFPTARQINQVTVTVSWPIWDGGRREVTVSRARAVRAVARATREDEERAAAERMAQAYNGYTTARSGIELALIGVAVSAENFRVQRARYREGASTILDLLEAQVGLGEAEATLVQSRYAARLALAQIEALLGRRLFTETP